MTINLEYLRRWIKESKEYCKEFKLKLNFISNLNMLIQLNLYLGINPIGDTELKELSKCLSK